MKRRGKWRKNPKRKPGSLFSSSCRFFFLHIVLHARRGHLLHCFLILWYIMKRRLREEAHVTERKDITNWKNEETLTKKRERRRHLVLVQLQRKREKEGQSLVLTQSSFKPDERCCWWWRWSRQQTLHIQLLSTSYVGRFNSRIRRMKRRIRSSKSLEGKNRENKKKRGGGQGNYWRKSHFQNFWNMNNGHESFQLWTQDTLWFMSLTKRNHRNTLYGKQWDLYRESFFYHWFLPGKFQWSYKFLFDKVFYHRTRWRHKN